jgi:NTE family protein
VYDNLGSENLLKENTPFIVLDASAGSTPWNPNYRPKFFNLYWRTLAVSLDQIVLLRRRLLFNQPNKNSIQLLLSKNINDLVTYEKEHRNLIHEFPHYSNLPKDIETLLSSLRTDLDSFHDIEIDFLTWAGAVRIDLALKSLFPQLIDHDYWESVPEIPSYPINSVRDILTKGQTRRIFGNRQE